MKQSRLQQLLLLMMMTVVDLDLAVVVADDENQ